MPHAASEDDSPAVTSFDDLGLAEPVLQAVRAVGYETPSAIQAATIPPILAGRDIVGLAQTGTGKTAAFALPVLSRIDVSQRHPQALVLTPTRELALQVSEAFERYASHLSGAHLLPIYGGQGYGVQLAALRRGVHVVVGTPGRIMDHLAKGTLDLSALRFVVLDEADEMLKMGFAEDVESILGATPDDKQVALFSATMPAGVRRIAQKYLSNPQEIAVERTASTSPNIAQRYLVVSYRDKLEALTRVLEVERAGAVIVFTRTKTESETVAEKLRARGHEAAAINGDVPQPQREKMVAQLRAGKLDILVATDVAARGLDVERISHVINYDLPVDTESYVHRIGRTGRAGRSGDAISFVTPRERRMLSSIEKATRGTLTEMRLPSVSDINDARLARFDDRITAALDRTADIGALRDVIAHYVAHHDVPELDVAAALAVVAQGDDPLLLTSEAEIAPPPPARAKDRGRSGPGGDMRTYRVAVGRRQHVQPGQIVGALTNEGGLTSADIGGITINSTFSLVELRADIGADVLKRLEKTRISGVLINLWPDQGRPTPRKAKKGGKPGGPRSRHKVPRGGKRQER